MRFAFGNLLFVISAGPERVLDRVASSRQRSSRGDVEITLTRLLADSSHPLRMFLASSAKLNHKQRNRKGGKEPASDYKALQLTAR